MFVLPIFFVVACGDSGPTGPAPLASITVSASLQAFESLGETLQLSATLKDAGGNVLSGRTVSWSSSNSAVVSVGASSGLATAVANGNVTITATAEGKSGSLSVTVLQKVTSVEISAPSDTLRAVGDTLRFAATPRDARNNLIGGTHSVSWISGNNTVASIDQEGLATAAADGDFMVEGTISGVKGSKPATVKQRGSAIRIVTQPAGARAGVVLQTQPAVEIIDSRGNRVVAENGTVVSAALQSGDGTIAGITTAAVAGGTATFANLAIQGLVGAKSLRFAGASLAEAVSQPFVLGAGDPAVLELVGGGGQTGLAGTQLPVQLSARLRDAYQNAIAQTALSWQVVAGGGQLSQSSTSTDAAGVAAVQYTLGIFAGDATVRATLPLSAVPPLDFVVHATPNATVSGTVTLSTSLLGAVASLAAAPPTRNKRPTDMNFSVAAVPLIAKPARASLMAEVQQPSFSQPRSQALRGAEFVPGELIVIYRSASLGVPASGAVAYRSQASAAQAASAIRGALTNFETTGRVRVRSVSPALLAARVEVVNVADTASVAAALRADPRVQAVEYNGIIRLDSRTNQEARNRAMHETPIRWNRTSRNDSPRGFAASNAGQAHAVAPRTAPVGSVAAVRDVLGMDSRLLAHSGTVPNDPYYPFQAWHYNAINLPQAWDMNTGSNTVIVAVVDDGMRFDHPGIAPNLTNDGFDFVSAGILPLCAGGSVSRTGDGDGIDSDPTIPGSRSYHSVLNCVLGLNTFGAHGLHVAGTIGAVGNDGLSVTGVNWNVRIRPVRVLDIAGSGTHFDIAQGILYAAGLPADNGSGGIVPPPAQGAQVINLSLGGTSNSLTMESAVIAATNAGSLVVAAAGNSGVSTPSYPAAYPAALSVSAVGPDLVLASYSNYGSTVDIAAPGGDQGDGDVSFGIASTRWDFMTMTPAETQIQGTSMAAPHVSGVAALIFAANPGISAAQVRARLTTYATDIGAAGPDIFYGAGLVNARNALTQSFGPSRSTHVRLMNAATGAIVGNTQASGGAFSFNQLADGNYRVYAGEDADGDARIGTPLRRWGALGGSAIPGVITVAGAATYSANFTVGFPFEAEPNNSALLADELPVGGYMLGIIGTGLVDDDYYRVVVPEAGLYIFETIGVQGACGFALDDDTILRLYNEAGSLIGLNDDLDFGADLLCSRIAITLQPGKYALRVSGYNGRYYIVMARKG